MARRAFSHSCLTLDNREDGVAFVVSHLLDPLPTEIHVLWSPWAGKPMHVTTSRGDGAIREGRIAPMPASGPASTAPPAAATMPDTP